MRSHGFAAGLLIGKALLTVCALASSASCLKPNAIAAASGRAIPATHAIRGPGSVPARDFIGQVRLGYGLDMDGKVPPCLGAIRFAEGDRIHFSMWEVSNAPAGSVVRVSVRDKTDRIVWSEDKSAPRGGSYVSFGFGRALVRGMYRADVIVADELRSRTGFEVFERKVR